MTQPCGERTTTAPQSHLVPDLVGCSSGPAACHPGSLGASRGAPRPGRCLRGWSGDVAGSTLVPITPALARPFMQLPCLRKVPPGEKGELRQVLDKPREPPRLVHKSCPSGAKSTREPVWAWQSLAASFQESATRGDGGGRRVRHEWSQSPQGRRLRYAVRRRVSFGRRRSCSAPGREGS